MQKTCVPTAQSGGDRMPAAANSRHFLCTDVTLASGERFLTEDEPYRYQNLVDNAVHTARSGDTWMSLAGFYFKGMVRPAGFWWAIADFQPVPVVDPTVPPAMGTVVYIPSLRTLRDKILDYGRLKEF